LGFPLAMGGNVIVRGISVIVSQDNIPVRP
jgi:hypothetical protein